jgi:hypothetical protein
MTGRCSQSLMKFRWVIMQALRDLADPHEGVYNATALLSERLGYINSMLNKFEKLPSRSTTTAATLGSSVPTNTIEEATSTQNGGGGLGGFLSGGDEPVPEADRLQDDADGKGGLMAAIMGWQNEAGKEADSSDAGSGAAGGKGAPSQQGVAILGGEPASMDALLTVPSGMGPSIRDDGSTSSSSDSDSSKGGLDIGQTAAGGRRQELMPSAESVRSSIVERAPTFKYRNGAVPATKALSAGRQTSANGPSLMRVKSLEEQVASMSRNSQSLYKLPGVRPSANVR